MTETRYPNESAEYRLAREALLAEEKALVEKVKAVAEQRRRLPLGGRIKEDYVFIWATEVWAYWNLMDFTPAGRPDRATPPQVFRSRYLEENYLSQK